MYARTTPAVFSGRSVRDWPLSLAALPRSSHVYISLETMSVSSPTLRENSSVASKMGVRISWKLYSRKTSRAAASTKFQRAVSGGNKSRVPRIALMAMGGTNSLQARLENRKAHHGGHEGHTEVTGRDAVYRVSTSRFAWPAV